MFKLAPALDYVILGLLIAILIIAIARGDHGGISLSVVAITLCVRVILLQIRPNEQP